MEASNISVIIADDHRLVLEALGYSLENRQFNVLATTHSGREAFRLVNEHQPDVLVLDLRIPDLSGHQVLKAISQESLPTRVLLLSSSKDPNDIAEAINNGAAGYLSKDMPTEELRKAIMAIASGETVFDRELLDRVLSLDIDRAASENHGLINSLTEQEIRILLLMSRGMSNPE
ncbi:MAG: response regulator transcription factor, partial [Anaerolineales bacterium]